MTGLSKNLIEKFERKEHSSPINEFIRQYHLNAQQTYERVGAYFVGKVRNLLIAHNMHEDTYRVRKILKDEKKKKNSEVQKGSKSPVGLSKEKEKSRILIKKKESGVGGTTLKNGKSYKSKTWDEILANHIRSGRKVDLERPKTKPVVGSFLREYARWKIIFGEKPSEYAKTILKKKKQTRILIQKNVMGRVRKGLDPVGSTKKPKRGKLMRSKKRNKKLGLTPTTNVSRLRLNNNSLVSLRALSFRNSNRRLNPYFYQFHTPIAEQPQKINLNSTYIDSSRFTSISHMSYEEQAKYVRDYAKLVDRLGNYQTRNSRPFAIRKLKKLSRVKDFGGQLKSYFQNIRTLKSPELRTTRTTGFTTIRQGVRGSKHTPSKKDHNWQYSILTGDFTSPQTLPPSKYRNKIPGRLFLRGIRKTKRRAPTRLGLNFVAGDSSVPEQGRTYLDLNQRIVSNFLTEARPYFAENIHFPLKISALLPVGGQSTPDTDRSKSNRPRINMPTKNLRVLEKQAYTPPVRNSAQKKEENLFLRGTNKTQLKNQKTNLGYLKYRPNGLPGVNPLAHRVISSPTTSAQIRNRRRRFKFLSNIKITSGGGRRFAQEIKERVAPTSRRLGGLKKQQKQTLKRYFNYTYLGGRFTVGNKKYSLMEIDAFRERGGQKRVTGNNNKTSYQKTIRTSRLRGYVPGSNIQSSGILSTLQDLNPRYGLTSLTYLSTRDGSKLKRFAGLVATRGRFANVQTSRPTTVHPPAYTESRLRAYSYKKSDFGRAENLKGAHGIASKWTVTGKYSRTVVGKKNKVLQPN